MQEYDQPDGFFEELHIALLGDQEVPPSQFGDFHIIREIGRGGMGIVYEASQVTLKRRVALKVLSIGLGYSSKAIDRFRREAEAAARLHHTNIVPIHYTGMEKHIPYNVMELVDGPSLDQVIRLMRDQSVSAKQGSTPVASDATNRSSPVSECWTDADSPQSDPDIKNASTFSSRAAATVAGSSSLGTGTGYFDNVARMIGDVADALGHAHGAGVVHRDIKPSNLLLSPDGRLSVTDFGLARLVEQPGMTMTGEFMGSPLYMSPQQISLDHGPVDHRTDIYSLGATLYELLTLRPPYEGENREQILHQVIHKEPRAARRINKLIPQDLETICRKAMEKTPDDRYQTAESMAEDLRRFVSRHAIGARRIGPVGHLTRWCRRNRAQAALTGFLAITIIAAASFFIMSRMSYQRRFEAERARIDLLMDKAPWEARVRLADAMTEFPERRNELEAILSRLGRNVRIESDEPGAEVSVRPTDNDSTSWLEIGTTPVTAQLPLDDYFVRFAKPGHEQLTVRQSTYDPDGVWDCLLPSSPGMVRIPKAWHEGQPGACRIPWLLSRQLPLIDEFEMDRTEVTNAEFKQFVDDGGYTRGNFWQDTLGGDWQHTIEARFLDRSRQVGPRYWVDGTYSLGLDDYPVVGVSWYEAMAYAKWANKQLPTLFHWMRAADFNGWYDGGDGSHRDNIGGRKGTLRSVDISSLCVCKYGSFDTLGNAREWCLTEDRDGQHYAMGGSFRDHSGKRFESVSFSAHDRLEDVGFRCTRYKVDADLTKPAPTYWRPIPTALPSLEALRDQFVYERSDLELVEHEPVRFDGIEAQQVSYAAEYGHDERITCYVLLPDDASLRNHIKLWWAPSWSAKRRTVVPASTLATSSTTKQ